MYIFLLDHSITVCMCTVFCTSRTFLEQGYIRSEFCTVRELMLSQSSGLLIIINHYLYGTRSLHRHSAAAILSTLT